MRVPSRAVDTLWLFPCALPSLSFPPSLSFLPLLASALLTSTPAQISHYPTLRSIPSDLAPPVLQEIESYKQALKRCYAKFGAEMVAFEVARTSGRGGHAHIQVRL